PQASNGPHTLDQRHAAVVHEPRTEALRPAGIGIAGRLAGLIDEALEGEAEAGLRFVGSDQPPELQHPLGGHAGGLSGSLAGREARLREDPVTILSPHTGTRSDRAPVDAPPWPLPYVRAHPVRRPRAAALAPVALGTRFRDAPALAARPSCVRPTLPSLTDRPATPLKPSPRSCPRARCTGHRLPACPRPRRPSLLRPPHRGPPPPCPAPRRPLCLPPRRSRPDRPRRLPRRNPP